MKNRLFKSIALSLCTVLCICACGNAKQKKETAGQPEPITAESQSIGLTGVGNARELGGYKTADGKTVKHGLLLRTAALGKANEEDITRLTEVYHLSEVADLRMDREVQALPDPEIPGVKNVQLRIIDEQEMAKKTASIDKSELEGFDPNDKISMLKLAVKSGVLGDQMYVDFLSGNYGKEGYKQMFEDLLALPEGEAFLFHCTQGKDRTGCAAMLILSALGVDEDTIMQDYLLTNTFNAELIENERNMLIEKGYDGEELDTLMIAMDQVNPKLMQNALDWMKENYGSVTGYITQELGVTDEQIEELKNKYLE